MGQGLQVFGTVDTPSGITPATLSIDDDDLNRYLIQWYAYTKGVTAGAILFDANETPAAIELKPRWLYEIATNGGLVLPPQLKPEQINWLAGITATLQKTATGYHGQWFGTDMPAGGTISFPAVAPTPSSSFVTRCRTWDGFKRWAAERRTKDSAAWFRGHGSNRYALRTSLHRTGRYRMDRYLANELPQFKNHVEASFGRRFDLTDGDDYATVLGLAQHHGVPTPLLDWTDSPYIAAFFAFADALELKRASASDYVRIFALSQRIVRLAPRVIVVSQPAPFIAPLTVTPLHNPRLYAQQGRFLVTNVSDLETFIHSVEAQIGEQHLFAVDVPVSCTAEALRDLAFMGLSAATMFPGLDGISRMIRHQMSYMPPP